MKHDCLLLTVQVLSLPCSCNKFQIKICIIICTSPVIPYDTNYMQRNISTLATKFLTAQGILFNWGNFVTYSLGNLSDGSSRTPFPESTLPPKTHSSCTYIQLFVRWDGRSESKSEHYDGRFAEKQLATWNANNLYHTGKAHFQNSLHTYCLQYEAVICLSELQL
jgi:hypothetical protein